MKFHTAVGLSAGLVASVTATGTLQLGVGKRDMAGRESHMDRRVFKRQTSDTGTVEESVFDVLPWSTGGAYYTNVTVGTPPQTIVVILDTGSSDLYFDASSAAACKTTNDFDSCRGGSFDSSKSSTYKVVDQGGFNDTYGDGSSVAGDYSTDNVGIGDVLIEDAQFGVATTVDTTTGFGVSLMGIGYSQNEGGEYTYPNMPELLVDAGAINSRLYSVFLNELGEASGTILFGGVDTSKYTGDLVTLDLLPQLIQDSDGDDIEYIYVFTVAVTGASSTSSGQTTSYFSGGDPTGQDTDDSLIVLLDTGSAAWTVPEQLYEDMAQVLGNDLNTDGTLPCSVQDEDISFEIEFGGAINVTVPIRDMVVPVYDALTNKQNTTEDGKPLCVFMVTPDYQGEEQEEQGFLTLGDSVLRSMYVVFDLDNGQVSIAQAIANASTSAGSSGSGDNIKVVQAGANGVAKAVGSGVSSASAQTNTIDPLVSVTRSVGASTLASAIATATGTAAVPADAQVSESGSSGSGGSSGGSSTSGSSGSGSSHTSSGAASSLSIPPFSWNFLAVSGIWAVGLTLGAGLVL